jgi:hypothetical protein
MDSIPESITTGISLAPTASAPGRWASVKSVLPSKKSLKGFVANTGLILCYLTAVCGFCFGLWLFSQGLYFYLFMDLCAAASMIIIGELCLEELAKLELVP